MSAYPRRDDADLRPIDPATGVPIGPLPQPGYYPTFKTLSQAYAWDPTTRGVVLDRVNNVPEFRYFNSEQAHLLEAICSRLLPQDDRDAAHRIPIAAQIDKRLFQNTHDGYRYADMPPDREAYALGMAAIDEIAQALHQCTFVALDAFAQEGILRSLHDGKPAAAHATWRRLPLHRFWALLVGDCAEAYYAHPWAWDEIGFGGPAYPRAYMRLDHGEPEPWETDETRYEWLAPHGSHSSEYHEIAGMAEHPGAPGQSGTH